MSIRNHINGLLFALPLSLMAEGETNLAIDPAEDLNDEVRTGNELLDNDFLNQDGLTGAWFGVRDELGDAGLTPYAEFTGQFLANADGGVDADSSWQGLLDFGLEADLETLAGWEGGAFFINAFYFHGNDLSGPYVGDFNAVSNIYTDTDFNIFNIFLQQSFADEQVIVKAGQIAVDDDFMVSETALLFINSAFGPLPVESGNLAAPIYPLAAPGALIRVEALENAHFQTAIYAGDAGPNQSNNHGFDWRTGGSAGWAWFGEAALDYQLLGDGVFKLGGYYATSDFTDFNTGVTESGLGAMYALIDHQIMDPSVNAFGLSIFCRGGVTPDENLATVGAYFDAGFALQSICFEDDAFGLACSHTWFGDDYLSATRAGGTPVTSTETVIEATYAVAVAGWLSIQPDLQYVINPHYSDRDALVVGARCSVIF
ncbi:carbohydrate porin [Cerasicoccus frondis]|uniref:carbohydrate porin n=1 Tax=Cerasicoccus frondis TaxID=490090 RepID=UPI0028525A04|nr:carbohydrate porin [Cerasicoccus frondis]